MLTLPNCQGASAFPMEGTILSPWRATRIGWWVTTSCGTQAGVVFVDFKHNVSCLQ